MKIFLKLIQNLKNIAKSFQIFGAGTIIYIDKKEGIFVKAKDEVLLILELQAENAKKMSVQDFLRGNNIEVGQIFE